MNSWRLSLFCVAAVAAGFLVLADGSADAGGRAPVHGDFNCNSELDGGDALHLLLRVAGDEGQASDSGCPVVQAGVLPPADVNCDGVVDVGDVITLARSVAGLPAGGADFCPQPGDDAGAPLVDLQCAAGDEPLTVKCRYDVWQSEHDIGREFDGADGEVTVLVQTSSAACDPGQVHCQYGYAAELLVVFGSAGPRVVSVTACDLGACATRSMTVRPLA